MISLRNLQEGALRGDQKALAKIEHLVSGYSLKVDWADRYILPLCTPKQVIRYVSSGWNGKLTLRNKNTGEKFTFRFKRAKKNKKKYSPKGRPAWVHHHHNGQWVFIGRIDLRSKRPRFVQKSPHLPPEVTEQVNYVLLTNRTETFAHSQIEFWHHGICGKCGKDLNLDSYRGKKFASLVLGLGPRCSISTAKQP